MDWRLGWVGLAIWLGWTFCFVLHLVQIEIWLDWYGMGWRIGWDGLVIFCFCDLILLEIWLGKIFGWVGWTWVGLEIWLNLAWLG